MKSRARLFRDGLLGGLLLAAFGAALGALWSAFIAPSAWGTWALPLEGGIYGYGVGAGLGAFAGNLRRGGIGSRLRALLGALSGLFAVIFLSEPLHLDAFPPLMWGLLLFLPPFIAAWTLSPPPSEKS
jgi:hypothetical protein